MKIKNKIFIFLIWSFLSLIKTEDTKLEIQDSPKLNVDYPGIQCGKEKIKKETDCTKYGTDSGMLCCYVKFSNEAEICTLLFSEKAKEFGIKGDKIFKNTNEKWSCGNKSFYVYINILIILILIFLY